VTRPFFAGTAREHLPDELAVREMRRGASNSLNPGFDTYKLQVNHVCTIISLLSGGVCGSLTVLARMNVR
jgi:hypothetical protein